MNDIQSTTDLEALKDRITALRTTLKADPGRSFWLERNRKRAFEEVAANNERAYAALPRELTVSPDIAQVLINLFTDDLNAKKAIEDRLPRTDLALGVFATAVTAIFAPSPPTLVALGAALLKAHIKFGEHDGALKELALMVDKNMKEILGSYRLAKHSDGGFVLTRGSWFVYSVVETVYAGQATHSVTVFYTAVRDVGVDPTLAPPEQRRLIDAYKEQPHKSPSVGRWK